jgi:hypothetical protein
MGGTLTPLTDADGETLVEHTHLVMSRARLAEAGRLLSGPDTGAGVGAGDEATEPDEQVLSAHG